MGDDSNLVADPRAWYAYVTLTGVDLEPDWQVGGRSFTGIDYLQFRNPGDFRVVAQSRGCASAGCHEESAAAYPTSGMATNVGIDSAFAFTVGSENPVAANVGLFDGTAASWAFRPLSDPAWVYDPAAIGVVGEVAGRLERAAVGDAAGVWGNPLYDAETLGDGLDDQGRVVAGSALEDLALEAASLGCSGCHAGDAGPPGSTGRFRGGGCTSCHMAYGFTGRPGAQDPTAPLGQPWDPDHMVAPERPHVQAHEITSTAQVLGGGTFVRGVADATCAACHTGSNGTSLQYVGVRVDPGEDVVNGFQYPALPYVYTLMPFDPAVQNETLYGYVREQLIALEDYDGDGRDDTPADVHAEAGMGCVDCHAGAELHGSGQLGSRASQATAIACESCHGYAESVVSGVACVDFGGVAATCATDRRGDPLRNVSIDAAGVVWLTSKLDGERHFVPQTHQLVVDTGALHPVTGQPLYTADASFAMGRANDTPADGLGPAQLVVPVAEGFSHLDRMSCDACHASWTNTCVGCHLELAYDDQTPTFSSVTGAQVAVRITGRETAYSTPLWDLLEVGPSGRIGAGQLGGGLFFRYTDLDGDPSAWLAFSDLNGNGNQPGVDGRGPLASLSHGSTYAHSIRGEVTTDAEGVRSCAVCHLNTDMLATWGDGYRAFRASLAAGDMASLDHGLLAVHLGQNPGNTLNSPYAVHRTVGLGTGLLQFDAAGCPVNPVDSATSRPGCDGAAPSSSFDPGRVRFDLDRWVEPSGVSNGSSADPIRDPTAVPIRDGALDPTLTGPLGAALLQRLADPDLGLVLDTWIDADGITHP
ncbi:MAG: hypothetical protein ABMA64_09570 [Myxococcota bacterium]